jgi:hypothetical protein
MQRIRIALVALALATLAVGASAQDHTKPAPKLTKEEWDPLLQALYKSDWSTASELSSRYLTRFDRDTLEQASRLRYMYILSSAGMVEIDSLSYDDFEKRLTGLVGQRLTFPGHPFAQTMPDHPIGQKTGQPGFNQINVSESSDSTAMIVATNADATTILAFEYVELPELLDISQHQGEVGRLSGVLDRFLLNPNRSTIWIVRLYLKDGDLAIIDPPRR